MTKKALIYARTSSSGAQENRQSTDRQVYSLTNLIEANGDELVKTFEEHISGATLNKNRVLLNECLQYAAENQIDIIYFSSLDRLGRAIWEVQENIKWMLDHRINAYFQKEQMSLFIDGKENPFLAIFVAVIATCSAIERDSIKFRLNDAREKKKQEALQAGITLAEAGFGRPRGTNKSKDQMREEYKECLTLLRKGYSVRNVAKITSRSKTTIQKLKETFDL
ncbi:MAG: recombinase family protein [Paludibacteraceae bacterium]|nr:recombinase family protein [Paludibacteraceae bacterium]